MKFKQGTRAIIYARVSSTEQKEKESIKPQITILQKFVSDNNLVLIGGYADDGRSAKKDLHKRKIDRILEHAKNNDFDVLIIDKWDRAFRNAEEQFKFQRQLHEYGKIIWAVNDTNDRLGSKIMGVMAEEESDKISYNVKRAHRGRAIEGKIYCRLKGYRKSDKTKKISIDPLWGSRIKSAIEMYILGEKWKVIQEKTKLDHHSFVKIFYNDAYHSYVRYEGQKYPIAYEPLFSEKDALKCKYRYWKDKKFIRGMGDVEFLERKKEKLEKIENLLNKNEGT